ncbi:MULTISPECIES: LysM peptidoglycan-binding domain-containing protein [Paenibacillus]|uniref:LysM peptidoglycan-binding domain-containing protein n=1 Tax=Paenibacillus TaxID=44249 RepID=UPI0022B937E1|nr:LysM peptidoglycan-binding domain-containing protein [Paenibacillus caseinilyticus]MCZ8519200.1 LysM peptidoglycan-binding domain-containing protein [Paenibacillus caseinilyticus]
MIYTVRPGDAFFQICQAFQLTPDQLMAANQLTIPFVRPGQPLMIPDTPLNMVKSRKTSRTLPSGEWSGSEEWRSDEVDSSPSSPVLPPQETKPIPGQPWLPDMPGHSIAVFKERILNKEVTIPIYVSRAAFFFMSKMAVEQTGCFAICGAKCQNCIRSENVPFYVLPHNTEWGRLGDYGVVINTRTKKATYAICADWGPKHSNTVLTEGTRFSGHIGEGSVHLGKQLDITGIKPNPLNGFEPFGVVYIIFPNTTKGVKPISSVEEINIAGHNAFKMWGGWPQAQYLLKRHYNIDI